MVRRWGSGAWSAGNLINEEGVTWGIEIDGAVISEKEQVEEKVEDVKREMGVRRLELAIRCTKL